MSGRYIPGLGSTVAAACLGLGAWLVGCGYTLTGAGTGVPQEIRTVHVKGSFEGDADPATADALTRALREQIRREGRFRLAPEAAGADAVLDVALVASSTLPVAFDRFDDVLDYETTIRVNAKLEQSDGTVLWRHDRISATRSHAAVPGAVVTSSSEFQSSERLPIATLDQFDLVQLGEERKGRARDRLVDDLAQAVLELMMEGR